VDFVAAVVSDEEPLELVQPGEGALHDPAVAAKAGAVVGVATGDLGCDPTLTELTTVLVVVVAAVGADPFGTTAGPADPTAHRRHRVNERDQLRDVVAVAARDRPSERDPRCVDQEMVLRSVSGSINRARARFGAPFFACT
jgi:hypothetical protein